MYNKIHSGKVSSRNEAEASRNLEKMDYSLWLRRDLTELHLWKDDQGNSRISYLAREIDEQSLVVCVVSISYSQ